MTPVARPETGQFQRVLTVVVIGLVVLGVVGIHPTVVGGTDRQGTDQAALTSPTYAAKDIRGLSVSTSKSEVVVGVGDSVTVSGSGAEGGSVRIYGIGPRGRVLGTDGVNHEGTSTSGSGSFSAEFSVFDRGGQYTFVAVAPGEDGSFSHSANTGTSETATQRQNVERIRNAYLGAGSDDQLAETQLETTAPTLTIDSPTSGTEVEPGDLSVSGTTNLPNGEVLVDLVEPDGDVAVSDNTTMSGGSWSVTMDLADVDPGRYTVHAHNESAGDKAEIWLLTEEGTRPEPLTLTPRPTPTPRHTPTEQFTFEDPGTEVVTRTVVQTVQKTVIRTIVKARNETTKSGGLNGFGLSVAVTAIVLSIALSMWRRRV